jgi:hypothetical protein
VKGKNDLDYRAVRTPYSIQAAHDSAKEQTEVGLEASKDATVTFFTLSRMRKSEMSSNSSHSLASNIMDYRHEDEEIPSRYYRFSQM